MRFYFYRMASRVSSPVWPYFVTAPSRMVARRYHKICRTAGLINDTLECTYICMYVCGRPTTYWKDSPRDFGLKTEALKRKYFCLRVSVLLSVRFAKQRIVRSLCGKSNVQVGITIGRTICA